MLRVTAAAVLAAFLVAGVARADDLLAANFDADAKGWIPLPAPPEGVVMDRASDGGRNGSGALHIADPGTADADVRTWVASIPAPAGRAFRVVAWIRGTGTLVAAGIGLEAVGERGVEFPSYAGSSTAQPLAGTFDWTRVEAVLVARPATAVRVRAFTRGAGEAWFDDVTVTAEPLVKGTAAVAPGLFDCRGRWRVYTSGARVATLLVPLPLDDREQVPLTYHLATDPPAALTGARVRGDEVGNAWLEIDCALTPGTGVEVAWRALVLCGPRSLDDLPDAAPLPKEWPREAARWLRATRCVQAADPRIRAAARVGSRDALAIVQAALETAEACWTRATGNAHELGAVEALTTQGSCTSCANLLAALVRANGVPARVLSGYPSWSGPLQTHYLVEAWLPGYGWYRLEPTMWRSGWPPCQQITVSIVTPEAEDASVARRFGAPGVPFRSLTECAGNDPEVWSIGTLDEPRGCDHGCTPWWNYPEEADWAPALAAARKRWAAWLRAAKPDRERRLATPLQHEGLEPTDLPALVRWLAAPPR